MVKGGIGDLFRTHVFLTAGNLSNVGLTGQMGRDLEQVTQDFRLSYGLGLAVKLGGVARIELNYCLPVKVAGTFAVLKFYINTFQASRGDKPAPGLQFGVGVHFL